MACEASASDRADVSGSVTRVLWARLFPSRLFGYTFLGNAKKVLVTVEGGELPEELPEVGVPRHKSAL